MANKPIIMPDGVGFGDETLSKYDEGTWTPTIGGGGTPATVSSSDCRYTRIGRVVTCSGQIVFNAGGSANGTYISLPITTTFLTQTSGASIGLGVRTVFTFEQSGFATPRDSTTTTQILHSQLSGVTFIFSFSYQL